MVNSTRRSFLTVIWAGIGLLAAGEMLWVGASFFKPRKSRFEQGSKGVVAAGKLGNFAPGSVSPFRKGEFYLSRLADGDFLALSSQCTHLGCIISWDPESGQFECPCHSSLFDIRGDVLRAPAPRALDTFPAVIENGSVIVLTGKKTKRDRFHHSQVTKA